MSRHAVQLNKREDPLRQVRDVGLTMPGALFALYCFFLVDYFLRLSARIPGYGQIRPTLLLVLLITLFLFSQRDKVRHVIRDPRLMAVWVLIGYILVSLPLVEWPGSVVRENFAEFVKAVVFLFFTALIVDTDRRLRFTIILWLGLQIVRVLEPLYLNITTGYWGSSTHLGGGEYAERLSGAPADVVNPNGLGFVIVTAIPFLHYLVGASPRWSLKLLYLALMPPMLYALILTASRGAIIALLVVAWMVFKESRHKLVLLVVGATLAAGAWFQMSDFQKDRYVSLVDEDSAQRATVAGRWGGMLGEFGLAMNRPLFGHGLGTTPEAKFNVAGGRDKAAHNLYAELIIEIGLIGFILFIRYLYRIYGLVRKNLEHLKSITHRPGIRESYEFRLNQALIAVFWMYTIYSINYFGLSQSYWYMLGGICIAFARSLAHDTDASGVTSKQSRVRRPAHP